MKRLWFVALLGALIFSAASVRGAESPRLLTRPRDTTGRGMPMAEKLTTRITMTLCTDCHKEVHKRYM